MLDQNIRAMLDELAALHAVPYWKLPPPEARRVTDDPRLVLKFNGPPLPLPKIENRKISVPGGEIPLRIYFPRALKPGESLPVIVYLHGGGWVLGSLDTYEAPLRYFCKSSEMIIVSVEYRLAPEFPFPTGLEDCAAAVEWVRKHAASFGGASHQVAIAGDSAGGNFAAALIQRALKQGSPLPQAQVLFYPALQIRGNFPSRREFGEGYFLTAEALAWFVKNYLRNPADQENPLVSPLLAPDWELCPPTFLLTAGYDPLRDEGNAFAEKLLQQGVALTHVAYSDMIHGFLSMGQITPRAHQALTEAAGFLKRIFSA